MEITRYERDGRQFDITIREADDDGGGYQARVAEIINGEPYACEATDGIFISKGSAIFAACSDIRILIADDDL